MKLKAVNPHEVKPSKIKMMVSGDAGVGKTWWSLDWPRPYLIDSEGGAVRRQYQDKLKKVNGVYFGHEQGSDDFETVISEIKNLCLEKHPYKTLIIDSFSHLYLLEAAEAEEKIGSDFGKDKKAANKPTRQLMRWVNKVDMNVILIAHTKPKWSRKGNEIYQDGNTFEGYSKMEYDLDLFIEILSGHKNFIIKKSRIESLPQGELMPLSYDKFKEVYGSDILEQESIPQNLSTATQSKLLKEYIELLNVPVDQQEKWLKKADVDAFDEMTQEQMDSLLSMLKGKIEKLKGGK